MDKLIDKLNKNISIKEKIEIFEREYNKIRKEQGILKESYFRDRLANKLDGKTEVQIDVGYIDVVTDEEIIEVKRKRRWKQAIGQIQVYGLYIHNKNKRIHLIDDLSDYNDWVIEFSCNELGIKVTFEQDPILKEIYDKLGGFIYENWEEISPDLI